MVQMYDGESMTWDVGWQPNKFLTRHPVRYIKTREKEVLIAQFLPPKATTPIIINTTTWKTNFFQGNKRQN